ncbi:trans-4-hydroxy-L-proline dehydratase [Saccharicrinis sp. FJH62]|uniref:trans-4-hydroxy-L-proline dehydratase n=1 Tax=Saccharicrinis sp. FJH62 TaxID=3344657 RepID=UPI0035D4011C
MNERISKLRTQSLDAVNRLNPERALLVTEFYKKPDAEKMSVPVQRGMCFKYIATNKHLCINEGELIVGERGPEPKATPTYPEISLHSPEDMEILDTRPKVSFKVSEDTKRIYKEVITPFWKGRTNRDRIMNALPEEWHAAYEAGMFTEFQEQRAPGHTVGGKKIWKKGMFDLIEDVKRSEKKWQQSDDSGSEERLEELKGMRHAAEGLIIWAERYANALEELAEKEKDETRRAELLEMARICNKVPAHAPETFHEALQHYWFIHLAVITELNPWDSFNPGRLDQHLLPFYEKGLADGSLTKERAVELLQAFWVKFNNHPSPPKVGVTAQESNTYTDFCLINVGGVKEDGTDAVNEMSYILLDVIEEMRLLQPSSMVQLSKLNPDKFIERAVKIVKTGFGQPSIFNTDAIVQELTAQGKSLIDARNGGASGCVESGAFGTEAYLLTGYFNIPKVLEVTLNNGADPRTGKTIGLQTGDPESFATFDALMEAFTKQLNFFTDIKIKGNNTIEKVFTKHMPVPFLSLIIDDCIDNAVDYNAGGARYNTSYIQGVGMGTITDALTALKVHVYDKQSLSMGEFLAILKDNFEDHTEFLYELLYKTPKYGNDDDAADDQLRDVFEIYYDAVDGKPNSRGGYHRVNLLPTTCHIYFGSVIKALPDGRKAGVPLSEGISPVQGADRQGPTSVIRSAAKIDHLRTGGTLLNQKFAPAFFKDDTAISKVAALVRSYFRLNGHHIQFNVVDADTLKDAQKKPQDYRDLIVRVAGYSDYFNDLGYDLQDEIIRRTAHEGV